jgi:hypothetical protein
MPSIGHNRERVWAEFESLGPDEVRLQIAQKIYGEEKNALAEEWLRRKLQDSETVAEAERLALQSAQASTASRAVEVANRAADAAERQASTAERATRIAIAALMVAIVAAILSLIAMIRGH